METPDKEVYRLVIHKVYRAVRQSVLEDVNIRLSEGASWVDGIDEVVDISRLMNVYLRETT